MSDTGVETKQMSPIRAWLMAARPITLPAAASPVVAGSAVAFWEGGFHLGPVLAALLLQIGANLANDVYDYHRGADDIERLGPMRVTSAGLLRPSQVVTGMWIVFGLAALLGVYLAIAAGWVVVLIGLASILAAVAYTGGPFPFGYYGLGDLFVFIFFGPVAVVGTYYVQAKGVSAGALWASLPMGLLTVAILVVNNLRDIETDRKAGKRTLAVRLGVRDTRVEYVICLTGAFLSLPVMWVTGALPVGVLLAWLTIPRALSLVRMIYSLSGRPLNKALTGTGQLELTFALLLAVGLVVMKVFG